MVARTEAHKAMLNERVTKAQERYGYLSEEFKSDATRNMPEQGDRDQNQGDDRPKSSLAEGPVPPGGFPRQPKDQQANEDRQNERDDEPER